MAASYGFHPEALFEYAEATNYYLHEASARVADAFHRKRRVRSRNFGRRADTVARGRGARDSALRLQPISFRHLLPLGAATRARHHLRNHALQPGAWLPATAHRAKRLTDLAP